MQAQTESKNIEPGHSNPNADQEEDYNDIPEDLSLGELDITSSDLSLKGEAFSCRHTSTY